MVEDPIEPGTPPEATPDERPRNPDGTFAPVPKEPTKPTWLIEQAREYGFSDSDIAEMDTNALGRACQVQRKRLDTLQREFATQRSLESHPRQPEPAPIPEDDLPDISHVDDTIAAVLRKQAKELRELRGEVGGVKQGQQRLAQRTIADTLDSAFSALDEKYLKLLGKGPASDLDEAELQMRNYLIRKAGIDFNNLPSIPKIKTKLEAEAAKLLGAETATSAGPYSASQKESPSPEEWERGAVARPTQRGGAAEPPGEQKAINNLTRKLRENGQLSPQQKKAIMDGIPD